MILAFRRSNLSSVAYTKQLDLRSPGSSHATPPIPYPLEGTAISCFLGSESRGPDRKKPEPSLRIGPWGAQDSLTFAAGNAPTCLTQRLPDVKLSSAPLVRCLPVWPFSLPAHWVVLNERNAEWHLGDRDLPDRLADDDQALAAGALLTLPIMALSMVAVAAAVSGKISLVDVTDGVVKGGSLILAERWIVTAFFGGMISFVMQKVRRGGERGEERRRAGGRQSLRRGSLLDGSDRACSSRASAAWSPSNTC